MVCVCGVCIVWCVCVCVVCVCVCVISVGRVRFVKFPVSLCCIIANQSLYDQEVSAVNEIGRLL